MKNLIVLNALLVHALTFAADQNPPAEKSRKASLSSENGRYVFGQVSDYRRDQFMLDTKTGRLWEIVVLSTKNPDGSQKSEYKLLQEVFYVDRSSGNESNEPSK